MGIQNGLGKNHARFQIINIRNTEGQPILERDSLNMKKYVVHVLYDYLLFRKKWCETNDNRSRIVFETPLTLKYRNEFLQEFQLDVIVNAVIRRIYMLDCFEGIESDLYDKYKENVSVPELLGQEHDLVSVCRYSTRKNEKMILKGIKGYALLPELPEDIWQILMIGELIHIGKNTRSRIISKGISAGYSQNSYRGLVKVSPRAEGARNHSQCDSLLLSSTCVAHTFPYADIQNETAVVEHEATTSKISEEQLFYCRQRGISVEEAVGLIVNGYAREVLAKLPMEFAVEAQKLLALQLEGSVG